MKLDIKQMRSLGLLFCLIFGGLLLQAEKGFAQMASPKPTAPSATSGSSKEISKTPDDDLLRRFKEAIQKGDYKSAIDIANDIKFARLLAQLQHDMLKHSAIDAELKDALKNVTDKIERSAGKINSDQFVLRGGIFDCFEDYPKVIADYQKALEIDPKNKSALEKLNQAQEIPPRYAKPFWTLKNRLTASNII